jgi:AcrR family transcriptional regulator
MYICQASQYDRGVATRSRNPRGEGARLREQLLRAASEVLDEVGDADRVSVRAIARRAGVSPTALYLHFPDRDAAVAAAVDAGFVAFNAAMRDAAVAAAGDPRAALEAMGLAYLDFAEQQAALYAGLFSARRAMTPGAVDRDEGFDGLVALLQVAEPAFDDATARDVAIALWSALHGFASLRTARATFGWPPPADFVRRLLATHLPG